MIRRILTETTTRHVMGLLLLVPLTVGSVSAGGCLQSEAGIAMPWTQIQIIENITLAEAFSFIEDNRDNSNFVLLDIRTPEEFSEERLRDAVNLVDYYSETFRQDLDNLEKDKIYLIYCRTGRRTGEAIDIMKELGYMEAYNMLGGITSWKAEGLPTAK